MGDRVYRAIEVAAKTAFKVLGQRIHLSGYEHIPARGPFLLASNHISYVDFIYAGLAGVEAGRYVRFMAKKELFDHRVSGPIMRSLHHISVDRGDGLGSYRQALGYLRDGEGVGIFPEATISRAMELKDFKTGAVRLATEAQVPVLPVIVWGTQRLYTKDHPRDLTRRRPLTIVVGEPLSLPGLDAAADTATLHASMSALLDRAIKEYPDQGAGAWWLPASYGGSAPSLERAAELDAAERRERIARRQARKGQSGDK